MTDHQSLIIPTSKLPANSIEKFDDYAATGGPSWYGELLKCSGKTGIWSYGPQNVELKKGTRLVAIVPEMLAGYVLWREFKYLYEGIMEDPEGRGDAIGAYLCRKHASLKPVSVTLVEVREQDFWREDYLRGKRPLDPGFAVANPLRRVECPTNPQAAGRRPLRIASAGG